MQKQIAIIKRFAEIGKSKSFDTDIEMFGELNRDLDEVQHAASKIEQGHKKLLYSMFWFIKHSQFDEIALNNLNNGNYEKAEEIWNKVLKGDVTSKNYSSYHNLSTLYIAIATIDGGLGKKKLQKGILLKCTMMHSDHFKDIVELVTGENLSLCSEDLGKKFVDEIIQILSHYLNKVGGISTKELILLFKNSPAGIQKYITDKFTEEPIYNIENQIEKTANKRKSSPTQANKYGTTLHELTNKDLTLLEKILGNSNVQYQIIVNKLAEEVLQCSIDFYNKFRDGDGTFDPGVDSLKIAHYAKSIGATGQVRNRIIETIEVIQEWVDDAPDREKQKKISGDIAFIGNQLEKFQKSIPSIDIAKELVNSCKLKLENIQMALGSQDEFYIQISDAVVNNALGMLISVVNEAQSDIQYDPGKLVLLPGIISYALSAMDVIAHLDMDYETKKRFVTNRTTINNINTQVQSLSKNNTSSTSGGCYIATMVYGDYDHPQVMVLRKFRDEKLVHVMFGKSFISLYYAISPHLVKLLKDKQGINRVIRNLLNPLVTKVK